MSQHLEEVVQRPIRAGDTVWVRALNSKGEVLRVDDGQAEVRVGRVRTQVDLSALELRKPEKPETEPTGTQITGTPVSSPGTRIDIRGQTVDESWSQLDRYLDQAMRAGLTQAHIIHGKGTGALRRAVREFLADHPLVSGYREAGYREGGEGVTIVDIVRR